MTHSRSAAALPDDQSATLALLESRFPERSIEAGDGVVSYRSCGKGPAIVLLHGIGSGAASWLPCALQLAQDAQVIAWNAPGYGRSSALPEAVPSAAAYALRLEQFLRALGIRRCVLVGHSLGAMMAAALAASGSDALARLLLFSPAQGYGSSARQARGKEVERQRLETLHTIGVQGMAQASGRMLSAQAGTAARAWVRWNMLGLAAAGYTQAVRMLCSDDIHRYQPLHHPAAIVCGNADTITTPEQSRALAAQFKLPFTLIDNAGHACYIEQADVVADLIRQASFANLNK